MRGKVKNMGAARHGENGIRNTVCTLSLQRTINNLNPAQISCNEKDGKEIGTGPSSYGQHLQEELQQPGGSRSGTIPSVIIYF